MDKAIKKLCLFSALLLCFSSIACSSGHPDSGLQSQSTTADDVTTAPVTNTIEYEKDDLPKLDFNGRTVRFFSPGSVDNGFSLFETSFTVEELTGDFISDSIYNRELYVEDRLGVEIENVKVIKGGDREIEKIFATDDDSYDAIISTNTFMSECAIDKYLTDLYTVDYLNFDKPWWSQNFSESAELFGSLYLCSGSLFISLVRNTVAMYYNKTLALEYSSSKPELQMLYDIVDSGDWTYDKMTEIAADIYDDANGNSLRDMDDIYGICYNQGTPFVTFWSGFDIDVFTRTEDGWFEFAVSTDKLYNSLEKISRFMFEEPGSATARVGTSDENFLEYNYQLDLFANGNSLFLLEKVGRAETDAFRNMKDDYGILPHPKYDSGQKNYYSFPETLFGAVAIPKMNSEPDVVGAVLEAMASYSYRGTMPLYLDTVLKGQYMSDPQSRRMIDLVVEGIKIDPAWIYIDTLATRYPAKFSEQMPSGNASYVSIHESNSKKMKINLDIYKKQLENN